MQKIQAQTLILQNEYMSTQYEFSSHKSSVYQNAIFFYFF